MRVLTTVIAHPDSLAGSPPARLCVCIRRTGILSLLSALKKTRPPSRYTSAEPTAAECDPQYVPQAVPEIASVYQRTFVRAVGHLYFQKITLAGNETNSRGFKAELLLADPHVRNEKRRKLSNSA